MREQVFKGWPLVPLSSIAEINPKSTNSSWVNDLEVSLVMLENISSSTSSIDKKDYTVVGAQVNPKNLIRFQENDILYARISPSLEKGKVALASNLRNGLGMGSRELIVIRPNASVLSKWLWHYFRQPSVRSYSVKHMSGTTQLRVNNQALKNMLVPLPSLKEQERGIKLLDQVNEMQKLRMQIPLKWNGLISVYISELFRYSNNPPIHLGDIAKIRRGKTPTKGSSGTATKQIPFIKVSDWGQDNVNLWDSAVHVNEDEESLVICEPGTILMGAIGSRIMIGRTVRLRARAAINQSIIAISSKQPDVYPNDYLWAILQSPDTLRDLMNGTTMTSSVTVDQVRKILIPNPLTSLRFKVAGAVQLYEEIRSLAGKQQEKLQKLYESLLQEVFEQLKIEEFQPEKTSTNQSEYSLPKRMILEKLSSKQAHIYEVIQEFIDPFSILQISNNRKIKEEGINREYIYTTLQLFVLLGLLVRVARRDAELWRLPNPEIDLEGEQV
ncbi:restriction endonuclease subunit S [Peribacillus frigoritolerans]|uniref:restriction endonuclease subunit S n=1 Tax=Peribacillus frigoritolerans TaxID=450367 RepID=UPI0034E06C29